ncbi:hypothetical protein EsH8_III_001335 [Colletotrichum jinshuiense]
MMPLTYPAVDNKDASFSLAERLAAFHIDELISSEVKDARPAVISERLPDWISSSNTADLVNWHLFEDQSGSSSEASSGARGHVLPYHVQYPLEPTPQQDDEPNGTRASNSIAPSADPDVPQRSKDSNSSTPPDPSAQTHPIPTPIYTTTQTQTIDRLFQLGKYPDPVISLRAPLQSGRRSRIPWKDAVSRTVLPSVPLLEEDTYLQIEKIAGNDLSEKKRRKLANAIVQNFMATAYQHPAGEGQVGSGETNAAAASSGDDGGIDDGINNTDGTVSEAQSSPGIDENPWPKVQGVLAACPATDWDVDVSAVLQPEPGSVVPLTNELPPSDILWNPLGLEGFCEELWAWPYGINTAVNCNGQLRSGLSPRGDGEMPGQAPGVAVAKPVMGNPDNEEFAWPELGVASSSQ